MIHFDDVKDRVINYLRGYRDDRAGTGEFYVIRDIYGKISIYIMGSYDSEDIKNEILEMIGENWIGQVRCINKNSILFDEIYKSVRQVDKDIYYGERPLVKKNWNYGSKVRLANQAKNITFYSYKGGVGRTTTLALTALQIARKGKKL